MANIKLSDEELQNLQQIQNGNKAVVTELGQIALAQLDLDKRQENVETFIDNLRTNETQLAKALEEKYGKGTINIDTGEFLPSETIATGAPEVNLPTLEGQEVDVEEKKDKKSSKKK